MIFIQIFVAIFTVVIGMSLVFQIIAPFLMVISGDIKTKKEFWYYISGKYIYDKFKNLK